MMIHYVIAMGALFGIFVLFLVLSKTLNNVLNQFAKLQYLLQKEYDLKKERIAIAKLMVEQKDKPVEDGKSSEDNGAGETDSQSSQALKNANNNKK
jgi:hypothetical protein